MHRFPSAVFNQVSPHQIIIVVSPPYHSLGREQEISGVLAYLMLKNYFDSALR
jgi:hypothetical protein